MGDWVVDVLAILDCLLLAAAIARPPRRRRSPR